MNIAFVIDHFRLVHTDQYTALSRKIGPARKVIGVEIDSSVDPEYPFGSFSGEGFIHEKIYKTDVRGSHGVVSTAWRIMNVCRLQKASVVFLCHYERPYIFLAAILLRILGRRVIVMGDSKFDDYPRYFWREFGKRLLYTPYQGALSASQRSADYHRFLGVPANSISMNFHAFDIFRIARAADLPMKPNPSISYEDRHFVCVARLVSKKNIFVLIKAFQIFSQRSRQQRKLILCGSGPLETELRAEASKLGVSDRIIFRGHLNPAAIARELASGLCLILPSLEEQYGIAVVEGQAMGLPVIVSTNCGVRDGQVRSGVNGFIVEPNNPEGIAFFMDKLANDEKLWKGMSKAAIHAAEAENVDRFVASVVSLARLD